MRARYTAVNVKPGMLDEFIKVYTESTVPVAMKQEGFKGALLLTDRNTGKALSMLLWETEADMRAGEVSSEERRRRVGETLIEPPVAERYEVSVQA